MPRKKSDSTAKDRKVSEEAGGFTVPKQTLTTNQGDIPVNPAASMDQVEEAAAAKKANEDYRKSQAEKQEPDPDYEVTNEAPYMENLETHEEVEEKGNTSLSDKKS